MVTKITKKQGDIPHITYVSAANAYIYHPASSFLLVSLVSSPWYRFTDMLLSMLSLGVILPDSVEVDRSSSASKDDEWEMAEYLDAVD